MLVRLSWKDNRYTSESEVAVQAWQAGIILIITRLELIYFEALDIVGIHSKEWWVDLI